MALSTDAGAHVVAHVFQVSNDAFRGKLGIFRIHQGTITPNTQLFIGDGRKPFKVAHLFRLQGKNQSEIPEGVSGDICAVARVEEIHRDAVLHDSHEEDFIHLPTPLYPQPIFGLALTPQKHGDEQKLSDALHRLSDEDPCLQDFDTVSKETVVRGLGEVHLKLVLEQLQSRWNLNLDSRPPTVPYRETITTAAEARYRHKKQSGGAGQFGEVALRIEPLPRGSGLKFEDAIKGGVIPGQYIPAVEKGIRQAAAEGLLAGFPCRTCASPWLTANITPSTRTKSPLSPQRDMPCTKPSRTHARSCLSQSSMSRSKPGRRISATSVPICPRAADD